MFYLHSSTVYFFLFTLVLFLFSLHHIDPTSTLYWPYIDLTSTLHRPYIDPISTPHLPYIDPTSTLHRPPSIYISSSSFLLFSLLFLLLLLFLLSVLGFTSLLGARFLSSIHSNDPRRHVQCHRLRRGLWLGRRHHQQQLQVKTLNINTVIDLNWAIPRKENHIFVGPKSSILHLQGVVTIFPLASLASLDSWLGNLYFKMQVD